MIIAIKKLDDKPSVLTITRSDGSSTWSKLHRGTESHDLGHFAVESTLKFKHAFFGIIDKGFTIQDFEAPRERRAEDVKPGNLHPEALITEHLVNLLQIELLNSGPNTSLLEEFEQILSENNLPYPGELDRDSLETIRTLYCDLIRRWSAMPAGEELNLMFNI